MCTVLIILTYHVNFTLGRANKEKTKDNFNRQGTRVDEITVIQCVQAKAMV